MNSIVRTILGPSPLFYGMKKIHHVLFIRGGSENGQCLDDQTFFELMITDETTKPPRIKQNEIKTLLNKANKARLTKEERLVKSIVEQAQLSRFVSEKNFDDLEEMYVFRRKYKNYLRIKRLLPLSIIGKFTGTELSKMAYATALGSKSVLLTFPGIIGYSLPAFYFFHMSGFYAPDKLKPMCQVCKYTLGAPVWIAGFLADELMSNVEEKIFGEEVPIDLVGTGGTIPGELSDINKLRETFEETQTKLRETFEETKDLSKKTY